MKFLATTVTALSIAAVIPAMANVNPSSVGYGRSNRRRLDGRQARPLDSDTTAHLGTAQQMHRGPRL
jgi:hypothetical protein